MFLDYITEYDKDRTLTEDANDLHTVNGYGVCTIHLLIF